MSFADSINGFKKTYATEYRDNNQCPFDETVDKNNERQSELIKFSRFSTDTISDLSSKTSILYLSEKEYDFDDEDFEDIKNFEQDKEKNTDIEYAIKGVDYNNTDGDESSGFLGNI